MNWLQKTSQEFKYKNSDYDYEISWDHEIDENVDRQIKNKVQQFCNELKSSLLPHLKIFQNFKVEFVNSLNIDGLATYISETYSMPIIAIDVGNIEVACIEYGGDCLDSIKISIVHELAHAIQEAKGKPFDEDEAEDFAISYYRYGIINLI